VTKFYDRGKPATPGGDAGPCALAQGPERQPHTLQLYITYNVFKVLPDGEALLRGRGGGGGLRQGLLSRAQARTTPTPSATPSRSTSRCHAHCAELSLIIALAVLSCH
jgi:hypothetical protein